MRSAPTAHHKTNLSQAKPPEGDAAEPLSGQPRRAAYRATPATAPHAKQEVATSASNRRASPRDGRAWWQTLCRAPTPERRCRPRSMRCSRLTTQPSSVRPVADELPTLRVAPWPDFRIQHGPRIGAESPLSSSRQEHGDPRPAANETVTTPPPRRFGVEFVRTARLASATCATRTTLDDQPRRCPWRCSAYPPPPGRSRPGHPNLVEPDRCPAKGPDRRVVHLRYGVHRRDDAGGEPPATTPFRHHFCP
jgi:hypothetical protein